MRNKALFDADSGAQSDLWITSYADLISAILAVLVLIMSFSKIDIEKYDAVQKMVFQHQKPFKTLKELYAQIAETAAANGIANDIDLVLDKHGLEVNLNAVVLFESGSAKLDQLQLARFEPVLSLIASASEERFIDVTGHTDDVPYRRAGESNWNLSADRSVSMHRYLVGLGMHEKGSRLVAYADTEPRATLAGLAENQYEAARARNRRVSILVGQLKELDKS
jgi:chemotaxis protein MotB